MIMRDVWTEEVIIEPRGLKVYISQIRRALGDNGRAQIYIETVPKRGYRFKIGVRERRAEHVSKAQPHDTASLPPQHDRRVVESSGETRSLRALLDANEPLPKDVFPYSFEDFPACLFPEGQCDITIVAGSSAREDSTETSLFRQRDVEVDVLGERSRFSRHVSYGTPRDYVRAVDVAAFLGYHFHRGHPQATFASGDVSLSMCRMDVTVSKEALCRNLLLIGGADTNLIVALATIAFRQRFRMSLPIRFAGDDGLYFTCDQIYSELSGRTYSRLEESTFMHCGYVLMTANPWAPTKVMMLAIGTRATGLQAALLALMQGVDDAAIADRRVITGEGWHSLRANNRYFGVVPAKVVRATRARVIGRGDVLGAESEIEVSKRSRISQRHIITGFEFLE
jgi:hypothetical protein